MLKVRLQVIEGARPTEFDVRLPAIIGRSESAAVKLRAAIVSRRHCELYAYEDRLAVRDLGSSNGTQVNGKTIQGPTFLSADDVLTVGPVTMRFNLKIVGSPFLGPDENRQTEGDESFIGAETFDNFTELGPDQS